MEYKTEMSLFVLTILLLGFVSVHGQNVPVCNYLKPLEVWKDVINNSNVFNQTASSSGPGKYFTLTPRSTSYTTESGWY